MSKSEGCTNVSQVGRLEQNSLYQKKQIDRYLKEQWKRIEAKKPMTLIFGARCVDGVVIVGDKVVTSGDNNSPTATKIRKCGDFEWAVFGAAGEVTLYEEFLNRLPERVERTRAWMNFQNEVNAEERQKTFGDKKDAPEYYPFTYTVENFKHDCVALLDDMLKRYAYAFEHGENCILQILIGVNVSDEAQLYYLDSVNCLPTKVLDSCFIGQSHLVEIFQKAWNVSMDMAQSAKLGALAIKYVEMAELSKSVGVGGEDGMAQIWAIPDGKPPIEITGETLEAIKHEVNGKVENLFCTINSLFRS